MRRKKWISAAAVLLTALLGAFAGNTARAQSGRNWTLEEILKQLDRMAGDFHSLTADLEHT
ncbi:MAG: hypothetical protein ACRDGM_19830, partial [bacterium]